MPSLKEIVEYLNRELKIHEFPDASLNGLQVEGSGEVSKVALSVDSGLSVIQKSASAGADLLIVHHGLFWEKSQALIGPLGESVRSLFAHELSLYAVHLPLDAHAEWGNNFVLGKYLGLESLRPAIPYKSVNIGCVGENPANVSVSEMRARLLKLPGVNPNFLTLEFGPATPKRVCVVTGSGADALMHAASDGFDTLITGEPRQFAYHYARENSLNVIFAGHYATETVGVRELGLALAMQFGVSTEFINEPTGI